MDFPLYGDPANVRSWIEAGGDVECRIDAGCSAWTPLQYASATGNSDMAELLIELGALPSTVFNVGDGLTALHIASRFGHEDIVKLLLKSKAETNSFDMTGFTPLHHAAANGHVSVVRLLLNAGASNSLLSLKGSISAAELSLALGHSEAVEAFGMWTRDQPGPLLAWLSSIGLAECAPGLLRAGFHDLDFIRSEGFTEDDLDAAGVIKPGHRKMLLKLYKLSKPKVKFTDDAGRSSNGAELDDTSDPGESGSDGSGSRRDSESGDARSSGSSEYASD